jgi:glycosyltransferase involved in cell wall biosynthesis
VLVIAGGARNETGQEFLHCLQPLAVISETASRDASTRSETHGDEQSANGVRVVGQYTLGSQLRVTGYLSDPDARAILEHTAVALLPYKSATGSYAASAALSAGCPLLTSDLPAFKEPLPALRFRRRDLQDLGEKLNCLLGDAALRDEMGRQSREYAMANSWARAAERHVALYRELIGSGL